MDIRLTGCRLVNPGFCQRRHAERRSYLYRLAVLKQERESDHAPILLQNPSSLCPLIEKDRCWPIGANFNVEAFQVASKEFLGEHNFASFMSKPDKPVSTMRLIKAILFEAGRPMLDEKHDPRCGWFDFYDITIVSKSFLYKQIRRMMGSMVAVAQQRLKIDDIRWLLENPHWQNVC